MKIEKINDRQIRCILTREDLESRKIKISELVYGGEKARSLFRDMLMQASKKLGFDVNNKPLMIEAVPSQEQLMLIITKVDDPEELDTRYTRFTPEGDGERPADYASLADNLTGADDVLNLLSQIREKKDGNAGPDGKLGENLDGGVKLPEGSISEKIGALLDNLLTPGASSDASGRDESDSAADTDSGKSAGTKDSAADGKAAKRGAPMPGKMAPGYSGPDGQPNSMTEEEIFQYTRFYMFRDLDRVIAAAKRISDDYKGENTLYKNPDDGAYYLLIRKENTSPELFNRMCNVISEYSMPMDYASGMNEFFREHMTVMLGSHALQSLKMI